MKQLRAITGKNLSEFADAMNEAFCELSRFKVEETRYVSDLSALIIYDVPDEIKEPEELISGPEPDYLIQIDDDQTADQIITIQLKVGTDKTRRCCECDNFIWSRKCPYRDGIVNHMDGACGMFNVIIERR